MSSLDPDRRSYLFAPGMSETILRKALGSDADAVVIDLEDAIDQSRRNEAHSMILSLESQIRTRPTHLRVGRSGGRYQTEDLELAARVGIETVRLPKVEDPDSVAIAAERLDRTASFANLHLTIESAIGLSRLDDLVGSSSRASRLVFGERDFLADLGVDEPGPLTDHARSTISVASRSAGLGAPVDGAFIDLDDQEGLQISCRKALELGFVGKSALHPRQIPTIHAVFTPSVTQLDAARRLLEAFDHAVSLGTATTVVDGRFVDEAVARRARSLLSRVVDA